MSTRLASMEEICAAMNEFVKNAHNQDNRLVVYGIGTVGNVGSKQETLECIECKPVSSESAVGWLPQWKTSNGKANTIQCLLKTKEGGEKTITLKPDAFGTDNIEYQRFWVHDENLNDLNIVAQNKWDTRKVI